MYQSFPKHPIGIKTAQKIEDGSHKNYLTLYDLIDLEARTAEITESQKFERSLTVFLAHLSHWLMVSYSDRWMCVVCRQQLL